jgi:hypothetical protein
VIGQLEPPQRHAHQNGPDFAIRLRLSQPEAAPRFLSEVQHTSSNVQYINHLTLTPLHLCPPDKELLGRKKYVDKLAILGEMQDIKLDFCYKMVNPAPIDCSSLQDHVRCRRRRFDRIEKEAALIAASSP